jgi:hypothetical protein
MDAIVAEQRESRRVSAAAAAGSCGAGELARPAMESPCAGYDKPKAAESTAQAARVVSTLSSVKSGWLSLLKNPWLN